MNTIQILGISMGITSIIGTWLSIIMYKDGYKETGKMLFQCTFAAIGFVIFMILFIGVMPMRG